MSATTSMSLVQRKKIMRRSFVVMLLAIILLPLSGYWLMGNQTADSEVTVTNPRADTWRQVRQGSPDAYTAVRGRETNVLIQNMAQNWRQLRNGPLATFGGWLLFAVLGALTLFYLTRGQVKLTHPRTGKTVQRWTLNERRLHWLTASLFIILAITGLSLLYGRYLLIPVMGHVAFAAYADVAKWAHNILGPVFSVTLLIILVKWFKDNLFTRVDLEWFKGFGGIIGDQHPPAGKFNGGEKLWYWTLATAGVAICVTGFVLDFPNFDQTRFVIQISHLIHLSTAFLLIAFAFGHIYIGTIGTEGALEGMTTGHVDTAWAEQHHNLWLEELQAEQQVESEHPDSDHPHR